MTPPKPKRARRRKPHRGTRAKGTYATPDMVLRVIEGGGPPFLWIGERHGSVEGRCLGWVEQSRSLRSLARHILEALEESE